MLGEDEKMIRGKFCENFLKSDQARVSPARTGGGWKKGWVEHPPYLIHIYRWGYF